MTFELHGIPNCDSCRAARKWLDAQGLDYRFVDLRKDGVDAEVLAGWLERLDWTILLNRRSTTWRGLDDASKQVSGTGDALALIMAHPTLLKRPVLVAGETLLVGFKADDWSTHLATMGDGAA